MDKVTLHTNGMISISDADNGSVFYACTEEDSLNFLEWFVGTRDKRVFENNIVFNKDCVLVRLVKE